MDEFNKKSDADHESWKRDSKARDSALIQAQSSVEKQKQEYVKYGKVLSYRFSNTKDDIAFCQLFDYSIKLSATESYDGYNVQEEKHYRTEYYGDSGYSGTIDSNGNISISSNGYSKEVYDHSTYKVVSRNKEVEYTEYIKVVKPEGEEACRLENEIAKNHKESLPILSDTYCKSHRGIFIVPFSYLLCCLLFIGAVIGYFITTAIYMDAIYVPFLHDIAEANGMLNDMNNEMILNEIISSGVSATQLLVDHSYVWGLFYSGVEGNIFIFFGSLLVLILNCYLGLFPLAKVLKTKYLNIGRPPVLTFIKGLMIWNIIACAMIFIDTVILLVLRLFAINFPIMIFLHIGLVALINVPRIISIIYFILFVIWTIYNILTVNLFSIIDAGKREKYRQTREFKSLVPIIDKIRSYTVLNKRISN